MLDSFELLKKIKETEVKRISLVSYENKKYILKEQISEDKTTINMLKNEVNNLRLLENTGITPKVINYNFKDGNNYILLEVIKGLPINRVNLENSKQKINLMLKICDAVEILHNLNIVHSDLKPANILLDVNDNIRIIDFDISIYNGVNYFKGYGSRHYCSVNHLTNGEITSKDDIYSLGVIFYELMLNKLPFEGTIEEIKNLKINCKYEKSEDINLNNIFEKVFNNNYENIKEFKEDINILIKKGGKENE